jgi:hypothetical protein
MAVEIELDVELKREIKKTYAAVSQEPEKDFVFPTGRSGTRPATRPISSPASRPAASPAAANPFALAGAGRARPHLGSGAVPTRSSPPRWSGHMGA